MVGWLCLKCDKLHPPPPPTLWVYATVKCGDWWCADYVCTQTLLHTLKMTRPTSSLFCPSVAENSRSGSHTLQFMLITFLLCFNPQKKGCQHTTWYYNEPTDPPSTYYDYRRSHGNILSRHAIRPLLERSYHSQKPPFSHVLLVVSIFFHWNIKFESHSNSS